MWRGIWLLVAVLVAAMVLKNCELIFQSRQYETNDYAGDSLQIIKAKHFRETVGQDSRYDFYHPGPAFLYVFIPVGTTRRANEKCCGKRDESSGRPLLENSADDGGDASSGGGLAPL